MLMNLRFALNRLLTMTFVTAIATLAVGCTTTIKSPSVAPSSPRTTKAASTPEGAPEFPEFASTSEVADKVSFDVKEPKNALGRRLAKVTLRDRKNQSDAPLPKGKRAVDMVFGDDIEIAQAPFESVEAAAEYVNGVGNASPSGEDMTPVKVGGKTGYAWAKTQTELKKSDAAGRQWTLTVPDSGIIWADGPVVCRASSPSVSWDQLLLVAESMYQ